MASNAFGIRDAILWAAGEIAKSFPFLNIFVDDLNDLADKVLPSVSDSAKDTNKDTKKAFSDMQIATSATMVTFQKDITNAFNVADSMTAANLKDIKNNVPATAPTGKPLTEQQRSRITSQVGDITDLITKYKDYGISDLNRDQSNTLVALIDKKTFGESLLRQDQEVRDYQALVSNGIPEPALKGNLKVKIDAQLSNEGVLTIKKIDKPDNVDLSFYK